MILKKADILFDIIFTVLLFMLPLSMAIPNLLLIILVILFLIKENKTRLNIYVKLVFILVLYLVLKALLNQTFIESFNLHKHLLTFLILSILAINIKNTNLVKNGFVFGVLSAVLISFIKISIYYFQHKTIPFGNSQEASNLLIIDRPYFGFICFLAIIITYQLIRTTKKKRIIPFYNSTIIFLIIFTYLIAARLSLGLIVLFVFVKIIEKLNLSKTKLILIMSVFACSIFILFLTNKNLKNRFHIKNSFHETVEAMENQEPRVVIWKCIFNHISKSGFNVFLGYKAPNKIQIDLNECYKNTIENKSKKAYYLRTKFNTHNQFFDFLLQGGIIGLLLFISLFCYSLYVFKSNTTALFILVGFIFFSFLENILHRQLGAYLLGIFIPLGYKVFAFNKE